MEIYKNVTLTFLLLLIIVSIAKTSSRSHISLETNNMVMGILRTTNFIRNKWSDTTLTRLSHINHRISVPIFNNISNIQRRKWTVETGKHSKLWEMPRASLCLRTFCLYVVNQACTKCVALYATGSLPRKSEILRHECDKCT